MLALNFHVSCLRWRANHGSPPYRTNFQYRREIRLEAERQNLEEKLSRRGNESSGSKSLRQFSLLRSLSMILWRTKKKREKFFRHLKQRDEECCLFNNEWIKFFKSDWKFLVILTTYLVLTSFRLNNFLMPINSRKVLFAILSKQWTWPDMAEPEILPWTKEQQ